MTEWYINLHKEIKDDIINQTLEGYDVGDLITLQTMLMFDYAKVIDHYYYSDITVDECVALKSALRDINRKISWSIYHGSYREMIWIEEFYRSIANGFN